MTLPCRFLSALIVCAVSFAPCLADTDISLAALVGRIEALEEQGTMQQTIISEQSEKIVQQEMKIQELMNWKEQQLNGNNVKPSNAMKFKQPGLESDNQGLLGRLLTNGNAEEADEHTKSRRNDDRSTRGINFVDDSKRIRNTKTRRALLEPEGPVAFHAVRNAPTTYYDDIGPNTHIVFNHVNTNLGGGYHNLQGLFIAPSSGVYIFSTSVLSSGDESLDVSIFKNGVRLASASATSTSGAGSYDQGSVTIVTQLKAGDEVWVKHHSYGGIQKLYGDFYTSFMGCRVVQV